jgi:RNA polymerase sigma-70 factor, ECF subfamily
MEFERLANEHKDAIYRQMLRLCGNREDAEDVLIDALLSAYRSLHQLRDPAAFRAWLAQIARRVCFQLRETEALRPLVHLADLEAQGHQLADPAPPPDDAARRAEIRRILHHAVDQLPPDLRSVYELRDLEDLPGQEVATRLDITLPAMKSRLHRARTELRQNLERTLASATP